MCNDFLHELPCFSAASSCEGALHVSGAACNWQLTANRVWLLCRKQAFGSSCLAFLGFAHLQRR